jgi:hypothetical protein
MEDQALSPSYDFGSSPILSLPSLSSTGDAQEDSEREIICWQERGVKWWGRSQNKRQPERLVLYK